MRFSTSAGRGTRVACDTPWPERASGGHSWRVHLNPATLVTPTVRCLVLINSLLQTQYVVAGTERTTKDIKGGER